MADDLDPEVQILFANADRDLSEETFIEQLMARLDKQKRTRMVVWTCATFAAVVLAWLFAAPLQELVLRLSQGLTASLIQWDSNWLTQILAPVSNVAGLLALCLLGLQAILRRILS